jgi:predicted enzyme related to lactoylglutathione lyase
MEEQCQQVGGFSWCELMTNDVPAAIEFYSKLFGWTTEEYTGAGMPYTIVKVADKGIGGIMKTPPEAQGMPPAWGIYVSVEDVDATAKKAEALGGKILYPPTDIPTVGRFCVIQDPQGAVISAISFKMP